MCSNPGLALEESQSIAWREGRRLLERAITEQLDYAFETTLGGNTFPRLADPELHIARVSARVAGNGHAIPEEKIRERYAFSLLNIIRLPQLTEVFVYDNSAEADRYQCVAPAPRLIVHLADGEIVSMYDPASAPDWAKAIVVTALKND